MHEAIAHFMGEHGFRSFCKLDVVNVHNFTRTVFEVKIEKSAFLPEAVSYLEINANSFLYHQIRCIMEVLFLVGRGLEAPSVVCELLRRADAKPNYPLADGIPLILWDCAFDAADLPRWETSRKSFTFLERELQDICVALLLRATMMAEMRTAIYASYHDGVAAEGGEEAPADARGRARSTFSAVDRTVPAVEAAGVGGPKRPRPVVPTYAHPHVFKSDRGVPVGAEDALERFIDNWALTGCDWTEPRSIENKNHRRYELFNFIKFEEELETQREAGSGARAAPEPRVYVPANYIPLLKRETERSYEDEVKVLTGKKKERYESNMDKKDEGRGAMEGRAGGQVRVAA
ncbi:tRNA pseudouridine synthase 3 [Strigomonas culicis]|uniref:tRNA pseudouridine synthase n=1 Tax=Strigomonas culicis TaxID=28005 RepID=S9UYJ3_9TRYP|nr:tRNA pseudouridine synthase 3 [Strigomonas culicis]|eukprot:EPY33908.1 tRNA pseudouridine synthase 3 [Strigomonas culicis]